MAQLARIAQHLENLYPRPKVDPEWLQGCYEWLISQPGADPTSQKFLDDVVAQLLQSDLTDSMLQGTGIPIRVTETNGPEANSYLGGTSILVEIVAITEIGTSAYQLEQIRVAREERMRLGQTDDGGDIEADLEIEGEGPMPRYPRGMLRFDLSDGSITISAIEYRPLSEIVLGQTPLGYKMLLKNPPIRHGIAFLEQNNVDLLGYQTADREALQKMEFARGLRVRMGLPLEPVNVPEEEPTLVAQPARSPLREIPPPPEPINPRYNDDANLEPPRRKIPSTSTTRSSIAPSPTLVPSSHSVSPYFSSSSSSNPTSTTLNGFSLNLTSAQASQAPPPPPPDDDDNDEDLFSHFDNIDLFVAAEENNENDPPPAAATSVVPSMANGSSTSVPSATIAGPSSSTRSRISPTPRSLVQEDSLEIVSFTSGRSQAQTSSQNKGKGKEKDPSPTSNNDYTHSNEDDSMEFDPDIRANLGESEFATFYDPEFLRQQREELARHNATQVAQGGGGGKGKGKEKDTVMTARPIKPLPRRSLSSQPPPPPLPRTTAARGKDVIEIESDDDDSYSSDASPPPPINPPRPVPLFIADSDEDEGMYDDGNDDGIYDDDDDEYDKENVPVMTRHVKRRVTATQGVEFSGGMSAGASNGAARRGLGAGEVIELSDED